MNKVSWIKCGERLPEEGKTPANQDDYDIGILITKIGLLILLIAIAFLVGMFFERVRPENNPPNGMPYLSNYLELYQEHELCQYKLSECKWIQSMELPEGPK